MCTTILLNVWIAYLVSDMKLTSFYSTWPVLPASIWCNHMPLIMPFNVYIILTEHSIRIWYFFLKPLILIDVWQHLSSIASCRASCTLLNALGISNITQIKEIIQTCHQQFLLHFSPCISWKFPSEFLSSFCDSFLILKKNTDFWRNFLGDSF